MRRFADFLFKVFWHLLHWLWLLVPFHRTWGGGRGEPPTREQLASREALQRRRAAQVGASPTDRQLARALIRSSDLPDGYKERWRGWTPLDPSNPIVVSVQQSWAARPGRLRRGGPTQQVLLELRRYWSEAAAAEEMAAAPEREMPDGGRMRQQTRLEADADGIRIFGWSRTEAGQATESVLELHVRRGTAAAILLVATDRPTSQWERQMIDLIRVVGSRLR